MKKTEQKIASIFDAAATKAQIELDNQVKATLLEIKMKHKYDSVSIISGMGTWYFKINNQHVDDDNRFSALDEFLRLMAGTHNIYTADVSV